MATIATICWARMSSGFCGTFVSSMSPACMRCAVTAATSRSPRNFGKTLPFDGSPTWWPARPIRCSPDATDVGDSTCTTRSMAPMSMPSSSDDVATSAGSFPALSASSISSRCSRAIEPWCARTSSPPDPSVIPRCSASSSLSCCASRSDSRRRVHEDQRRRVLPDQVEEDRVDRRPDRRAHLRVAGGGTAQQEVVRRGLDPLAELAHVLDGDDDLEVELLANAGVDDRHRAVASAEVAGDLLEGTLRRRQADALRAATRTACRGARATAPGGRPAWWPPSRGSRR